MKDLKIKTFNFLDGINNYSLKILKLGNMFPNFVRNFLIYEIVSEISIEQNIYKAEIKKFYLKNKIMNKFSNNLTFKNIQICLSKLSRRTQVLFSREEGFS